MKTLPTSAKSKENIRRQNLAALLTCVHIERTISRAALVEQLGLSKTTISELVTELEEAGLLDRAGNAQSGTAGRPSQLVTASKEPLVLVVNPEIDGINIALVNFAAEIDTTEFIEFETAYSLETTIALIKRNLASYPATVQKRLRGIVFAVPGAVESYTGKLIDAPSLGWRDLDIISALKNELHHKAWVINNARAATISEHLFGAAKGLQNAICLFSGVGGIGGGMVVNGQVLEGSNGVAGEIGKMRLLPENSRSHQSFGELMRRDLIVESLGKSRLSDEQIDALIPNSKDPDVNRAIDSQVAVLQVALETLRDLFDPDAVILGGYLGSLVKSRKQPLLKSLNSKSLKIRGEEFLVPRASELKPMVLIGAAEAAWSGILQDPIKYKKRAKNA